MLQKEISIHVQNNCIKFLRKNLKQVKCLKKHILLRETSPKLLQKGPYIFRPHFEIAKETNVEKNFFLNYDYSSG